MAVSRAGCICTHIELDAYIYIYIYLIFIIVRYVCSAVGVCSVFGLSKRQLRV